MPNFNPPAPLQCFNPDRYASFEDCNNEPSRCIAPTARGPRCSIRIFSPDRNEATRFLLQAQHLPDSDERDELIAQFILLCCCRKHHSWRLRADDTGCWDKIVKRYSLHIGMVQQMHPSARTITQISTVEDTQTAHEPVETVTIASRLLIPQASMGMILRSGTTIDPTAPRRYCDPLDYFIPFEPEPGESILRQLLADIDEDWPEEGEIYLFQWPEHPDFVKIGYSAWSALGRFQKWQKCHPGATLSKLISIEHPKTIERLIHLELVQDRYRIAICRKCGHSHEEWFKSSIEKANQVMSDWKQVLRRETLYDEDRKLTQEWRYRLYKLDGEITARALLDLLDAEEQSHQEPVQEVTEVVNAISRVKLSVGLTDSLEYGVSQSVLPTAISGRIHDLSSALTPAHQTGLVHSKANPASGQLGTELTKISDWHSVAVDATIDHGVVVGTITCNTETGAQDTSCMPDLGSAQIGTRNWLQPHPMPSLNSRKPAATALMQDSKQHAIFTFDSQTKSLPGQIALPPFKDTALPPSKDMSSRPAQTKSLPGQMALPPFKDMVSRLAQTSLPSRVIQPPIDHFEWTPALPNRRPYGPEASQGCSEDVSIQLKRKPVNGTRPIAGDSTRAPETSTTSSMPRSVPQVHTVTIDALQSQDTGTSLLEESMLSLSLDQRQIATGTALWPVSTTASVSSMSEESVSASGQGRITRSLQRGIS